MDLDIHPEKWIEFFHKEPVLLAVVVGLLGGFVLTIFLKRTWVAFGNPAAVTYARFTIAAAWLNFVVTYWVTHLAWWYIPWIAIAKSANGLERFVCFINGLATLFVYWAALWFLNWKAKDAAKWVSCADITFKDTPPLVPPLPPPPAAPA